jgi:hypothetical protein
LVLVAHQLIPHKVILDQIQCLVQLLPLAVEVEAVNSQMSLGLMVVLAAVH